jgi:putative ABC transport system permease protein
MFWFRLKRTIKLGGKSLWMHRLRSILTTLGIVFGVCSVIAMLAIGQGASQEAQAAIAKLGSTNVIVKTVKPPANQTLSAETESLTQYGLTYDDAESFRETIPNVQVVVPLFRMTEQAWYRMRKAQMDIVGTVPWYPEVAPIQLLRGRFLTPQDMEYRRNVCVVDEQVADQLFIVDDPLGRDIKVKGAYYQVVGVVTSIGATNLGSEDSANMIVTDEHTSGLIGNVYICLTTFKNIFGETQVQYTGTTRTTEKVELQEVTIKVDSIDQIPITQQILESILDRSHTKKDYQVVVPFELLRQARKSKRIYTIVLSSIAAISLLVGGIGIMNIMLASVSERTREIGIRRAMGAKQRDIIFQFLSETVMLTLSGGLLGIIIGISIPYFVTRYSDMPTVVTPLSLILSFGISGAVGIIFGLYPAYRAAHMDPIESLRHE